MMELKKLQTKEQFEFLRRGDDLIVVWNPEAEVWSKEMEGRKSYKIIRLQKGSLRSTYNDEIILRKKGNIFFNYRLFLNGESNIVKEVYVVRETKQESKNEK